jgi:hypothetical protein
MKGNNSLYFTLTCTRNGAKDLACDDTGYNHLHFLYRDTLHKVTYRCTFKPTMLPTYKGLALHDQNHGLHKGCQKTLSNPTNILSKKT